MIAESASKKERFEPWHIGWSANCSELYPSAWEGCGPDIASAKNFAASYAAVLQSAKQLCLFVDIDEEVLGGTPRIGGTRIPVYRVLDALNEYGSINEVLSVYGSLDKAQIHDAIQFAARVLEFPVAYEAEIDD
jgi:uncharacterized protein (DUF433 family)